MGWSEAGSDPDLILTRQKKRIYVTYPLHSPLILMSTFNSSDIFLVHIVTYLRVTYSILNPLKIYTPSNNT